MSDTGRSAYVIIAEIDGILDECRENYNDLGFIREQEDKLTMIIHDEILNAKNLQGVFADVLIRVMKSNYVHIVCDEAVILSAVIAKKYKLAILFQHLQLYQRDTRGATHDNSSRIQMYQQIIDVLCERNCPNVIHEIVIGYHIVYGHVDIEIFGLMFAKNYHDDRNKFRSRIKIAMSKIYADLVLSCFWYNGKEVEKKNIGNYIIAVVGYSQEMVNFTHGLRFKGR